MKSRIGTGIAAIAAIVLFSSSAIQAAPVSRMDRTFATKAAQGGMAEVQAAKIALQHGVDGDVRMFAQHMLDDHSKANMKLMRIAANQGIALPAHTDAMHQMGLEKLSNLSGSQFDRAYINAMVKDHVATVSLFQHEANTGRNGALRQFASSTLPTLKQHRSMSYHVASVVMPSPRSGVYAHRRNSKMHPMRHM